MCLPFDDVFGTYMLPEANAGIQQRGGCVVINVSEAAEICGGRSYFCFGLALTVRKAVNDDQPRK